MKQIGFLVLLLLMGRFGNAQFITGNAEGKGTIPIQAKGLVMGLDLGKTEFNVGISSYTKALTKDTVRFAPWIGGNLAVKNAGGGIGRLFSSGDLVAGADANLIGGFSFSNRHIIAGYYAKSNQAIRERKEDSIRRASALKMIEGLQDFYKAELVRLLPSNQQVRQYLDDSVQQLFTEIIAKRRTPALNGFYNQVKQLFDLFGIAKTDSLYVQFEVGVKAASILHQQRISTDIAALGPLPASSNKPPTYHSLHLFALGGINARNFTWFKGVQSNALASSFVDTLYRGGFFGLGINVQRGRLALGATLSWQSGDNYHTLTSKDYVLRRTDTAGGLSLQQEKKITAVSGNYGDVRYKQLNIDLLWLLPGTKGDTSRLVLNPYVRSSFGSSDTALLKNITNIGIGLLTFGKKSKFLGGLYVELPDVSNNYEKAKPADQINIRPPFRKLSFGIRATFTLGSVLSFANRPSTVTN